MQDLSPHEYDALRAEERDRMNSRLQVWTIFLSLVGAFGFISTTTGTTAYVTVLFPLLAMCLARHVRHSEDTLHMIRKYLYKLENDTEYPGYEHWQRTMPRATHGGYLDALQMALIATELLAVIVVVAHLLIDQLAWVNAPVILIEGAAMYWTWRWLEK